MKTKETDTEDIFRKALDEALIARWIGTVDHCKTVADVEKVLHTLCDWEIAVATDPKVNGGYKLVKVDQEYVDEDFEWL